MKVLSYIVVLVILFLVYIVFVGSTSLYDVITGTIAGAIVSAIATKYLVSNPGKLVDPKRLFYLLKHILVFIRMEISAHIDIVKRIIRGKVNPGIVKIPYDLESDYAVTLVACSITNTPGTYVIDLDTDDRAFYVHWIDVKTLKRDEMRKLVSLDYEKCAKKIFD